MSRNYTPLRYPGGKNKLFPVLLKEFALRQFDQRQFVEPYAGGASVGLKLLLGGYVSGLVLNDIDPNVAAFWKAVVYENQYFVERLKALDVTEKAHYCAKELLSDESVSGFERGFAYFIVNRTSFSGIRRGGILGGKNQAGSTRVDSRFNKVNLARRVKNIGYFADKITVLNEDALDVIDRYAPVSDTVFYLDPPYFMQGEKLYDYAYFCQDHLDLKHKLLEHQDKCWLLSYDDCFEIRELFAEFDCKPLGINYSLNHGVNVDTELLFYSRGMKLQHLPVQNELPLETLFTKVGV